MSLNPGTPKPATSAPAAKVRGSVRVQRWVLVLGCLGLAALVLLPVLRRPVAPGAGPAHSARPLETSNPTTTPTDPSRSGDDTAGVASTTSGPSSVEPSTLSAQRPTSGPDTDPPQTTGGARQRQLRTPVSNGVSPGAQVAALDSPLAGPAVDESAGDRQPPEPPTLQNDFLAATADSSAVLEEERPASSAETPEAPPRVESAQESGFGEGRWIITGTAGCGSLLTLGDLIARAATVTGCDGKSQLLGLELGRVLKSDLFGLPVDLVGRAGVYRHLEPDPYEDATQYTVQLEAVWTKFPWDHKVRTRLGVAEGFSYVDKIPYVEHVRHIRRINAPETAQFLSFMSFKLGVNLHDVLKPISSFQRLSNCFGGGRIAHRSGAWGMFANVYGASNYPGLFVECSFGRKK